MADTSDDLMLAKLLQHEFDQEHDNVLQKEEDKWNGTSKGNCALWVLYQIAIVIL